jgi:hypothetical protein
MRTGIVLSRLFVLIKSCVQGLLRRSFASGFGADKRALIPHDETALLVSANCG